MTLVDDTADVGFSGDVVVRVRDITKSFGGIRAVDDVSFDIRAGEILGVIGPNGCGKTTLFNCSWANTPGRRQRRAARPGRQPLAAASSSQGRLARTFSCCRCSSRCRCATT